MAGDLVGPYSAEAAASDLALDDVRPVVPRGSRQPRLVLAHEAPGQVAERKHSRPALPSLGDLVLLRVLALDHVGQHTTGDVARVGEAGARCVADRVAAPLP